MRIYLASSWRNTRAVMAIANLLRAHGHEVDAFCDEASGRYGFDWSEIAESPKDLDAIDMLGNWRAQKAYSEDLKWLDWCEAVVLVLPAGKSAHMEAAYGKGQGKRLYIVGGFRKGEWEVMYGMADGMFRGEDVMQLVETLAARGPDGRPGERDPECLCDMFDPGPHDPSDPQGTCAGDGHHLCAECKYFDPESVDKEDGDD